MQEYKDIPEDNDEPADDSSGANDDLFFAPAPKKAVSKYSMMGFGGIVVVLGIFLVMHFRGPSAASAAAALPPGQANQTIALFLSGGTSNIHDMESSLENTQKQVRIFENYPSAKQIPLVNLKTNPFAYHTEDLSGVEEARKKAEQQAAIEKAAQELSLQSIMYLSRSPGQSQCMINNTLCRVGGQIDGFTIVKINPNSIVLNQGSLHFELKIQK
jgi:hypothetical protein